MTISRERTVQSATMTAGVAQFVVRGGRREDQSPLIALGEVASLTGAGPGRDWLYLICEPVEPTGRAIPVGAEVLAALRDVYAENDRDDPIEAMVAAVHAANKVLFAKNRATAPAGRVSLGVTCLIVRGAELFICQVPPTQTIIAQNEMPHALPELASWRNDYQPRAASGVGGKHGSARGLGMRAEIAPQLFRTTLERGDLITLCSSNLAAVLADEDLGPLLANDPDAARDFLAELATQHRLDPAYAVVITPPLAPDRAGALDAVEDDPDAWTGDGQTPAGPQPGGSWIERGLREMRERSRVVPWPRRVLAPQSRVVPLREGITIDADDSSPGGRTGASFARWDARDDDDDELPDELDRDDVDAIEQFLTNHRTEADGDEGGEPAPRRAPRRGRASSRPMGAAMLLGMIAGAVAGWVRPAGGRARRSRDRVRPLGSLERWETKRAPRLGRWLPLLIVAAIVLLGVGLVASVRVQRARAAEARFERAVDEIASAREAALGAADRSAARGQVLSLQDRLEALPTEGQPRRQERVAAERAALAVTLDRVEAVERLGPGQVQTVATRPIAAGKATGRPQIVVGGGQQFVLLDGELYLADTRDRTMKRILGAGETVAGSAAGKLLGIAWRVDSLFAFDERRGYLRSAAGGWSALPLDIAGRKVTAVDSFGGNLYLLEAERAFIGKFVAGDYASPPQPWTNAKGGGELAGAIDMTIDKNIYVLLADGRVLDFFGGELKSTLAPVAVPALAGVSAVHAAPDGRFLYLVDPREGRIVCLGRDGAIVAVYKAAPEAPSFAGAREIAVDEGAGIAYVLTDAGLLAVRLPALGRR